MKSKNQEYFRDHHVVYCNFKIMNFKPQVAPHIFVLGLISMTILSCGEDTIDSYPSQVFVYKNKNENSLEITNYYLNGASKTNVIMPGDSLIQNQIVTFPEPSNIIMADSVYILIGSKLEIFTRSSLDPVNPLFMENYHYSKVKGVHRFKIEFQN